MKKISWLVLWKEDTIPPDDDDRDGDNVIEWYYKEKETSISVLNETSLSAAKRLHDKGMEPLVLNFASAKNPGGGFQNGALAQEESLCRSSALYECIRDHPFYQYHREQSNNLYSRAAIYTPAVPVFKDDEGNTVDKWLCSFVTSAACNLRNERTIDWDKVRELMSRRIYRIFQIGINHGHDALVLGAWGCGVFRNDSDMIAKLFRNAMDEWGCGYKEIVYAVLDKPGGPTICTFTKHIGENYTVVNY
jgi:uncharacterized protein (TIGR02452 family)